METGHAEIEIVVNEPELLDRIVKDNNGFYYPRYYGGKNGNINIDITVFPGTNIPILLEDIKIYLNRIGIKC